MFKFQMGTRVSLIESGEKGKIIGLAEYDRTDNNYLIRYKAGDGRCVEDWWTESAIRLSGDQDSDPAK